MVVIGGQPVLVGQRMDSVHWRDQNERGEASRQEAAAVAPAPSEAAHISA
jgi:hypothetical protein